MTNAPFMLNVDCDMYTNNPQVALHALCLLLSPNSRDDTAFVQCPQQFYNGLEDDPFGNQLVVVYEVSSCTVIVVVRILQLDFYRSNLSPYQSLFVPDHGAWNSVPPRALLRRYWVLSSPEGNLWSHAKRSRPQ